jgi:histidine ammonia-lyase
MITIDGCSITIQDVLQVARHVEEVQLDPDARMKMLESRGWVEQISRGNVPVYGINTGFGIFAEKRIPPEECSKLSRNLILSHSVGTGDPLPTEIVRAAMLVRANTLAKGHSGVRPEIVEILIRMLNKRVTPVVPSQGSMGSSGDLGPLSHMALVFTTDDRDEERESGFAEYQGHTYSGKEAMRLAGLERIILGPKEGLALNNGATFSAAIAAINVYDAIKITRTANLTVAMTIEALEGCSNAFDERIHRARGQSGQIHVANEIRDLIEGSTLVDRSGRVQDAYSLRCVPQVHGSVWDTALYVKDIVEREINAATDNPLLFDRGIAISGGNFHGEPVALAMDFLGIALCELGAISERRIFRLIDGKLNGGLPNMLVDNEQAAGLNSGLMMPQYTAASLVLENQTLATPDSIHSLPTSGEQEDHNSNSMTAARHTWDILTNVRKIIAIEVYTTCRALDLRLRIAVNEKLSPAVQKAYSIIRDQIPYHAEDSCWGIEIDKVTLIISEEKIL